MLCRVRQIWDAHDEDKSGALLNRRPSRLCDTVAKRSAKHAREAPARTSWIHSSRLHVVLYSLLLVATPFLILRRFLQEAIGKCSAFTFELAGTEIPLVPVLALLVVTSLLIYFHAYVTRLRILAAAVALIMIAFGQQINDYYFDHKFYELQQNWHYIAYAIFAFMMYRDLAPRGYRPTRIMLITYFSALSFSTFDESFQLKLSGRAFEMGDIAKDVWGTVMGMVLLYLGENRFGPLLSGPKVMRHRNLRGYLDHPFTLLALLAIVTAQFLCLASLLPELADWTHVVILTIGAFGITFFLLHISRHAWAKYGLATIALAAVLAQGYFFVKHRDGYITHNGSGLIVYKGIPLPFFDVLIFPDGMFRPVEKRRLFGTRHQAFLLKQKPDIIVIGSGVAGTAGRGFPEPTVSQFIYNRHTQRGTQVITLKNAEACQLFNRLKRAQKNVLFVLYNG